MENSLSKVHNRHYRLHPSQRAGLSHFHAVTDGVWCDVRCFLRVLLSRRANGQVVQPVEISSYDFDVLLDFLSQMSWSYRSPRRDSQLSVQS